MTNSSTSSSRAGIGKFSADEVRSILRNGKAQGLIVEPAAAATANADARGGLDTDALRNIVQEAKAKGLIRRPGEGVILKDGAPVADAGSGGSRSQWMEIDPAKAQFWLEKNFRNRPINPDVVAAYARDMLNGVWVATHQGVAFNDRDELIDGQHRLRAIILSGLTVRMMVTFGLPSKINGKEMTTMDCVDRGRTRSVADQLKIQHGMKNGSITAAICVSLGTICSGERTRRMSVGQTLEIYRAFEHAVTWVIMHRSREHGFKGAGLLAAFAFAMTAEKEDLYAGLTATQAMYQNLIGGTGLKDRSPMKHLWAFLISDDAVLLSRGSDRGMAELVLLAIMLELGGERIPKLELSPVGAEHFRKVNKDKVGKIAEMFLLPKVQ